MGIFFKKGYLVSWVKRHRIDIYNTNTHTPIYTFIYDFFFVLLIFDPNPNIYKSFLYHLPILLKAVFFIKYICFTRSIDNT